MSPTYWTASQIKMAAREHDWEFIPAIDGAGPWGMRKGRNRIELDERRDGGLSWVKFVYPISGGTNCDYLGPRYRNKLTEVLEFLKDPNCRAPQRIRTFDASG